MIAAISLSVLLLIYVAYREWRFSYERERIIAASELARKEQARAAARREDELLNRIQAPEFAIHHASELEPAPQPIPDLGPWTFPSEDD